MPKRFVVVASRFPELPRFPDDFDLAEALTGAARRLHETSTPHSALDTAVRLAVELMPGAEHAGICSMERGSRRTLARTDDVVRLAEEQPDTGPPEDGASGERVRPHWDRLWHAPVAEVADSTRDESGRVLSDLGLRSALSLRLRAERRRLTVLTVYARKPHAFDEATRRVGRLLTAHVGIALDSATVREQLTEAMRTRDLIGQATGILMERMDMDAAAAFDSLVRASQRENTKLRDLARRIVDSLNSPEGGR
ncbi:GAF and ANTAR domain-containing protein [Streptomyces sp. enrichment culture]|uniref:GAF and ANTAR domain-containing protein n=1 Tax=Streptomyces sp. enrichment culture TaxID=1795815 RepID=UPI003F56670E